MRKSVVLILFILMIIFVVLLSFVSTRIWGGKGEEIPDKIEIKVDDSMTFMEFAKANNIQNKALKEIFKLKSQKDLIKKIPTLKLTDVEISNRVNKFAALHAEEESKNWYKIFPKFVLWVTFLFIVFRLFVSKKITARKRIILYGISIVIFGVIMGSDPSPMGTIKDAVYLLGKSGVVFFPRLIALVVFLLMVVLANKFICSWGCQFGVFQDFIFRINRNKKDTKGIFRQYKIPFVITNSVRILVFAGMFVTAFVWVMDLFEHFDPFKIFKPGVIAWIGGSFIGILLIASLFVYRPWCHFFCPFGLFGWLFEKLSIYRIRVDYDKCIDCGACEKACPSTVMSAILRKNKKVIPDCFSCSSCVEVCPSEAVHLSAKKPANPLPHALGKK